MFKKEVQVMLIMSLSVICIGLLAAIIGPTLLGSVCKNTIIQEIYSPNKSYKIVIFSRDCGATTGFSTQVSVLPAKRSIKNRSGNIFIADTDHGKAPSGPGGGPIVSATWTAEKVVEIKCHDTARIFKEITEYNGIQINYNKISEQSN